jgi:hypothetical protein
VNEKTDSEQGNSLEGVTTPVVEAPGLSTVTVYGYSDDLIEVEGSLSEEFNPDSDDQDTWLIFGDGTVLAIRYDEFGVWRITCPYQSAGTTKTFSGAIGEEGDREDGKPAYSDVVTLTGDLRWVVAAEKMTFHKIPPQSGRAS